MTLWATVATGVTFGGITIIRFENKDVIARPAIVSDAVLGFAEGARE